MRRKKAEAIYLYRREQIPSSAIQAISDEWTRLANEYGDRGSCVVGAGICFTYSGVEYKLSPMGKWQGSLSWESGVENIMTKLRSVGGENVWVDFGTLD